MISGSSLLGTALAIALVAGCGGKVVFDVGASGGSGGESSSGSSTTGKAVASSGGGSGTCNSNAQCKSGFVCVHSDGLCGKGVSGACTEQVAHPCPLLPPMCFCDGTVSGSCAVADRSNDPALCSKGMFPCGSTQCKDYLEYCQLGGASPSGGPDAGCVPAPATCTGGLIDCNCLQTGTDATCMSDGNGATTVFLGQ